MLLFLLFFFQKVSLIISYSRRKGDDIVVMPLVYVDDLMLTGNSIQRITELKFVLKKVLK